MREVSRTEKARRRGRRKTDPVVPIPAPRKIGAQRVARRSASPDERALLGRLQRSEAGAFEELDRTYHDLLRGTLRRLLGDDPDLEDVLQNVRIELFRSVARFEGRAKLSTWITALTLNVARRHRRKRRMLLLDEDPALDFADPRPAADPFALVAGRDLSRRTCAILDSLSPVRRDAFVAIELEGASHADFAAREGIPAETVRTRLHCARREFWRKAEADVALAAFVA